MRYDDLSDWIMAQFLLHGGSNWLVVEPYPSEKYEFVNWDDSIPNIWENKSHVPVTTNQINIVSSPSIQSF